MRDSLNGRRDTHVSSTALTIIAFGVVIAGLVYGRPFLLPLALAIFLWNLMEAMVQGFSSARSLTPAHRDGSQPCSES
jgi:predicted PurR-regulated permease PerM